MLITGCSPRIGFSMPRSPVGLAYNQSTSDTERNSFDLKNFRFKNVNLDGIGRFGVVWNNTRWYAGMSTIIHSYNYRKSQFLYQ